MTQYEREQIVKDLEGLAEYNTCPSYIKDALALIRELLEDIVVSFVVLIEWLSD